MSRRPAVRVREPKREGQEIVFVVAEDSLPLSHPARLLWTALGDFDLSAFVVDAKAVAHTAGRRVYSPRMMLTLWGYALSEGVVHARQIARLIHRDVTYRWIVGDVDVGRSRLSLDSRLRRWLDRNRLAHRAIPTRRRSLPGHFTRRQVPWPYDSVWNPPDSGPRRVASLSRALRRACPGCGGG